MQETQEMRVRSLGQDAPLEKEVATHSSILAWEWVSDPGVLSMGESHGQRSLMGYSPWGAESEVIERI